MQKRPTLKDIAQIAGVGVATVDRVINARAPVSEVTSKRVLKAAEQLNYHQTPLMRRRVEERAPHVKFGFILQKKHKRFYQNLAKSIEISAAQRRDVRVETRITFVDQISPTALIDALKREASQCDAIAIVPLGDPGLAAEIQNVQAHGVHVVSLVSPIPSNPTARYVGLDSEKAGRTAGWMMAKVSNPQSEVAVLIGSHRYFNHETLEKYFRLKMNELAPKTVVHPATPYLDDGALAYEATLEILNARPNLTGLYQCGGGVGGVTKALQETNKDQDIFFLCHDKGRASDDGLRNGTVDMLISCPIDQIAASAVNEMANMFLGRPSNTPPTGLDISIFTPENV